MKARRFSLDLALDDDRPPIAGDTVVTARTVNRVVEARPVESRVWGNRWKVTLHRTGERTLEDRRLCRVPATEDGARCFVTVLYRPGETPERFFAGLASEPSPRPGPA